MINIAMISHSFVNPFIPMADNDELDIVVRGLLEMQTNKTKLSVHERRYTVVIFFLTE